MIANTKMMTVKDQNKALQKTSVSKSLWLFKKKLNYENNIK